MAIASEAFGHYNRVDPPPTAMLNEIRGHLRRVVCPFDEILAEIPEASALFDIGCGTGSFLELAAAKRGCELLGGTETQSDLIRHAKKRLQSTAAGYRHSVQIWQAAETFPPLDEFTVFTMVDVLHHIPKDVHQKFFKDLVSAMPERALFILKDIDGGSPLAVFNKLHDLIFSGNGFQEIAASEAAQLMKQAGLRILSVRAIRRFWYPHFLIVARKL